MSKKKIRRLEQAAYPRSGAGFGIIFLSTEVERQDGTIDRAQPGRVFVHDFRARLRKADLDRSYRSARGTFHPGECRLQIHPFSADRHGPESTLTCAATRRPKAVTAG